MVPGMARVIKVGGVAIHYKSMTTLSNRNGTLVVEGPNYCGYSTQNTIPFLYFRAHRVR